MIKDTKTIEEVLDEVESGGKLDDAGMVPIVGGRVIKERTVGPEGHIIDLSGGDEVTPHGRTDGKDNHPPWVMVNKKKRARCIECHATTHPFTESCLGSMICSICGGFSEYHTNEEKELRRQMPRWPKKEEETKVRTKKTKATKATKVKPDQNAILSEKKLPDGTTAYVGVASSKSSGGDGSTLKALSAFDRTLKHMGFVKGMEWYAGRMKGKKGKDKRTELERIHKHFNELKVPSHILV